MKIRLALESEFSIAMDMINMAKKHLKDQGIDQWQTGYPDEECIRNDIKSSKGFFFVDDNELLVGYVCIDFDGEPAYDHLNGSWSSDAPYVVAHRMAFTDAARGKGISQIAFALIEDYARNKGISSFRVDTDADNKKMRHILEKFGFIYRGTIWFDNSEKIAFDKSIR